MEAFYFLKKKRPLDICLIIKDQLVMDGIQAGATKEPSSMRGKDPHKDYRALSLQSIFFCRRNALFNIVVPRPSNEERIDLGRKYSDTGWG